MARRYEEFLQAGDHSYADAARKFDVSRVTVCHYIALVRRLPADFVSWLESQEDAQALACFRECRLRSVTRLRNEPAQLERLTELAREILAITPDTDSGLAAVLNLTGNETWPGKELRSICLDR